MTHRKNIQPGDFFRDAEGRVVIWQWPNLTLYGWIILRLLGLVVAKGHLRNMCEQLSTAFLFTWAFLELTKGVNYFRRVLGLAVLLSIASSYYR